jgi:hypothetical protein
MNNWKNAVRVMVLIAAIAAAFTFPTGSSANHSWNGYHWARTSNPFTIQLGDSVSLELRRQIGRSLKCSTQQSSGATVHPLENVRQQTVGSRYVIRRMAVTVG